MRLHRANVPWCGSDGPSNLILHLVIAWRGLGFASARPDNAQMDTVSDQPHGFQFPGVFELSAMGAASAGLESELPRLLATAGVEVLDERISWQYSSNGKYVSVRIAFRAMDRAQYDAAHALLRGHPEVKWTL